MFRIGLRRKLDDLHCLVPNLSIAIGRYHGEWQNGNGPADQNADTRGAGPEVRRMRVQLRLPHERLLRTSHVRLFG